MTHPSVYELLSDEQLLAQQIGSYQYGVDEPCDVVWKESRYNKIHGNTLYNSITEKTIGFNSRVRLWWQIILNSEQHDSSPVALDQYVVSLIRDELLFQGFIVPLSVGQGSEEQEKEYLMSLYPVKQCSSGFFGLPNVDFRGLDSSFSGVLFLGVPCDQGAPRPGTRFGPRLLRERSIGFNFRGDQSSLVNLVDMKQALKKPNVIYDIGDIKVADTDIRSWVEATCNVISIMPKNSVPFMVGGDHTLTLGAIRGVYKKTGKSFSVIQFDHHLDLQMWGECVEGRPVLDALVHSNFMSWVVDSLPETKIYQVGIFDYQSVSVDNTQVMMQYVDSVSSKITNFEVFVESNDALQERLPSGEDVYITIDVDVLNFIYMPHTGYPGPTGISLAALCRLLFFVLYNNNVVGVDIMEFGKSHNSAAHYEMSTFLNVLILKILEGLPNQQLAKV